MKRGVWLDDDPVGVLAGCGLLLLIELAIPLFVLALVILARLAFA